MKIVVLSGAGISAESGLGTFRDSGGLWEKFKIEDVATPEAWQNNPELVLEFYNARRQQAKLAEPNKGHYALVELASQFDVEIITQNIDDLHERAGSKHVLHLHGEIFKAKTAENDRQFISIYDDIKMGDLAENGRQLRPHVVWFGEPVPAMDEAMEIVSGADCLIVVGTSLQVYPAASLIHYAPANCELILVDPSEIGDNQNMFSHIKAPASVGLPNLVAKLMAGKEKNKK